MKVSQGITWRKIKDEAVILNLGTSVYYTVNSTGAFIWGLLAAGKPAEKIALALAAEYELSQEEAAKDTCEFLKAVSGLKLTEPC